MGRVYISIYLYLLQFLSTVSHSFLNTGLLPHVLNLSLGIIFDSVVNGIFSLVFLSDSSLLVYINATDSGYLFCILQLF